MKTILKVIALFFLVWVVCGFEIPNYDWYVTDKVGVFSETQKADLNSKIQEIEQATSIEIAVLVVPTVDDDINLAAVDVGNKRGVGKKGQNNGLMVLIAIDDRKRSIQVWYGLEGTLPDIVTKNIGEADFPPNFKNWDYYQGIVEMLDDVLWYIKQDPTIVQTYSQNTSNSSSNDDYTGLLFILFFIAIGGFGRRVTVPSVKKGKRRKMRKHGRWMYGGAGLVLSLLVTLILASFIVSAIISYLFLLFGVLMSLYGKTGTWGRGIRFGWGSGGFGGGGSSFGGFGWGGFGGGGWGGSW